MHAMTALLEVPLVDGKSLEAEMAKKEKALKRRASLVEAGLDDEAAEAAVAKFENLDDESFDSVALVITEAAKTAEAKMPPALKEALDKKKEKEEEAESKKPRMRMATTEAESEVASEEEESEESEETSAEILDSVEVEEEVNLSVGEEAEDSVESTRAALVDFVNSRLSTQK
jgi:hypothetical protein